MYIIMLEDVLLDEDIQDLWSDEACFNLTASSRWVTVSALRTAPQRGQC